MGKLLRRRLLQAIPLLLGVIVLNFLLVQAAPGSLLDVMTAENQVTDPAMLERLRTLYGVDRPWWEQLLRYIGSVATFDFGWSYRQNQPVIEVIMAHLPATVLLMVASLSIALVAGVAAGIVAAARVNTLWDNLLSFLAILFFAAPSFWLGIMLTVVFAVKLGWVPVGGMQTIGADLGPVGAALDVLHHLVLPATALGLFYAAIYARVMRASMLEVLGLDFVRTARAKGLSRIAVLLRHAARNALLPIVTLLGLQFGTVLGGSIVVETVFSWPGLGALMLDSVASRNYPVVLGILVLGSLVVIVVNILVDLAYARLDPRIRAR
jgi:peptide/nickel transport system permease protein